MIRFLSLVVLTLFVLGFLVVGPVIYFFGFSKILWIFFLVSVFIFIGLFFSENKFSNLNSVPVFIIIVLLFFLFIILGVIINYSSIGSAILSLRWYFFVWPIMFVFMLGDTGLKLVDRIWRFLLLVAALQFPIVLCFYFFVSLPSKRASPWDAVVGTFPGAIDDGGQSAAMGLFVIVMILAAYALWRAKKISANRFLIQAVCGVMTLAFAEVKAVVLLLPVLFVLYHGRDIFRRPVKAGLPVLVALCVTVLLLSAYKLIHYDQVKRAEEVGKYVDISVTERVVRSVSPQQKIEGVTSINRVSSLALWGEENLISKDILHALFGYGIGATQTSSVWSGEIAKLYPYPMEASSSVILLWETGLFGHILFVLMLLYAARESSRLSKSDFIPDLYQIFLRVGYVALLLLIITLPYKNFILRSVPIQLLLALLLGQILYWLGVLSGVSKSSKSLSPQ